VPAGGQQVASGSNVQVWLYSVVQARVPSVALMTEANALATLRAAGFNPVVQRRKSVVPSQWGKVIQQSPAANATLAKGASVTIVVGVR
jgi:serine/threonine-protein kinase